MLYVLILISSFFFGIENFVKKNYNKYINYFVLLFLLVPYLLLFGLRNSDVGTDTINYILSYENIKDSPISELDSIKDIGYVLYVKLISIFDLEANQFIFSMSLLYLSLIFVFIKIIDNKNKVLILLILISFPFFRSFGINILRQGISIILMLIGILLFQKKIKKKAYLAIVLALLFHISTLLILLFYLGSKRIKKIKVGIIIYICSVFLAFLHLDLSFLVNKIPFLSGVLASRMSSYLSNTSSLYKTGFRIDFVAFNTFYLIIGYIAYRNLSAKLQKEQSVVLNLYMLLSSFFFLMFNIPYSDRFGILSWVLIPLLLVPFLTENIKMKGSVVIYFIVSIVTFIVFNLSF